MGFRSKYYIIFHNQNGSKSTWACDKKPEWTKSDDTSDTIIGAFTQNKIVYHLYASFTFDIVHEDHGTLYHHEGRK